MSNKFDRFVTLNLTDDMTVEQILHICGIYIFANAYAHEVKDKNVQIFYFLTYFKENIQALLFLTFRQNYFQLRNG